jgi:cysteine desulfurase
MSAVYLDCNATTPLEPEVAMVVRRFMEDEYGNAGSRTHGYGSAAKQAVQIARQQVACLIGGSADEVVFTSGATESNNLAILGLAAHGEKTGRKHIVSTAIEHKAVLEPLAHLRSRGFDVTLVPPTGGGWVDPADVAAAVRADTLLVSVMQVNNETGVAQPIAEIAAVLADHPVYLHVDAAQGAGKDIPTLRLSRLDLVSLSGHKLYGPKGVGALLVRRRRYERPPLTPLSYGGGQERGLRPGTLPVPLVVGLGLAAEIAGRDHAKRAQQCREFRQQVLAGLAPVEPQVNGDPNRALPHVLNLSVPGVDSEAGILAVKDLIAISNGSACTSASYTLSHVLLAMGLPEARIRGALRLSWCHMTPAMDWCEVCRRLAALRA